MNASVDLQTRFQGDRPARPAVDSGIGILKSLADEIRHADFNRLADAIERFRRAPRAASGYPLVRPADCSRITEGLRAFLQAHRAAFAHGDPVVPDRFFSLIADFLDSDLRAYPTEIVNVELLQVEALLLIGRNEEALARVGPKAERPYLIEDNFALMEKTFVLDTRARLNAGLHEQVRLVALGRVLLLASMRRRSPARLFDEFFTALAIGSLFPTQYSALEVIPRLIARLRLHMRIREQRGSRVGAVRRFLSRVSAQGLGVLGGTVLQLIAFGAKRLRVQALEGATENSSLGTGGTLVTRAMGGIGDIVMMTPGLDALARRRGEPVHFATKRQFFPLLEGNPRIRLLDIEQTIDLAQFERWVNLSICPAGRYESTNVPHVRKGRVELFADALGVRQRHLDRYGWRPLCHLSPEQQRQRDAYRSEFHRAGLPVIGVQPYSRDTYKNAPALFEALPALADWASIVLFHTVPIAVAPHRNLQQVHGRPLPDTLAAVAACDYFVSVDTAFFHVSAAFDLPTLGIFGPTGDVLARHHARTTLLKPAAAFPCAPCWRNEDHPCHVSGGQISACLAGLRAEEIVAAVARLAERHPTSAARTPQPHPVVVS